MGNSCLPKNLKGKNHWDWPWPLSYIPRSWTSYCLGKRPPEKILGNQKQMRYCEVYKHLPNKKRYGPAPIGEPGTWLFAMPFFIGFTLKNGWHFHMGARWDDVDVYYTIPSILLRWYPGEGERDTST